MTMAPAAPAATPHGQAQAARGSTRETPWLRGLPACRRDGGMVYVTLALEPTRVEGPVSVGWSAGGLHATTPRVSCCTAICCIPRGVFDGRALVRLELLDSTGPDGPVLAWTQFPVLGETVFRAGFEAGLPTLRPLPVR